MAESNRKMLLRAIRSPDHSNGSTTAPVDGNDLKRADDAEREDFDPKALTDAASEAIDSATGL
jgi:hypothetical protein